MHSCEFEKRIRMKELLNRVRSPKEAAKFVKNGMLIGIGASPWGGTAQTFFVALASEMKGKGKIKLISGSQLPYEVDGLLVETGVLERRFGQFSDKFLLKAANERTIPVVDTRTGIMPHQVMENRYGKIDAALVQAAAITEDGNIIPTMACLDVPNYVNIADKVIVEINTDIPEEIEGIHDIYIPAVAPKRMPIPLTYVGERIGTPYIPVNTDKIAAIIKSTISDDPPSRFIVDKIGRRIGTTLVDFLQSEVDSNRLPKNLLPLQFGVGSVSEAVAGSFSESSFNDLEIYTGAFMDGCLDLIDIGKVKMATTSVLYLSKEGFDRFYGNLSKYKEHMILRPVVVTNSPEVVARLGVIAINSAVEVDIYGNANSTHIQGSKVIGGIGGSGEFLWNAYLSILVLSSVVKGGDISSIVPMVTHVDHPEHCIDVVITEQGFADLRGLGPVERALQIINNCAHPDYKPILEEYLKDAINMRGGHQPHILERAFQMHNNFRERGSMKL